MEDFCLDTFNPNLPGLGQSCLFVEAPYSAWKIINLQQTVHYKAITLRIFLCFIEFFVKYCFAEDFMVLGVPLTKVRSKLPSDRS